MKKIFLFFICFMFLFGIVASEETVATTETASTNPVPETTAPATTTTATTSPATGSDAPESGIEQVNSETEKTGETTAIEENEEEEEKVEFDVNPGLTPDSPFYFVDDLVEKIFIGDSAEKALAYREEKIAEAREMVKEGKVEKAERVLEKALEYGDVLEEQVDPEIKNKIKDSTKKVRSVLRELKKEAEGEEWGGVREKFDEGIEKEKRIETAAELASKIKELCDALAKLDPLQYADTCRAKDNSPRWIRERDSELTEEQEEKAEIFIEKLSVCFEEPENCDCKGMGIQSFEDFCLEKSSFVIKCKNGDEESCSKLGEGDPTDLLPDYLIPIFKKFENKYTRSEFGLYMPKECEEAGASSPEECNKIMFQKYSPQECIDAGLTGESKEDERKCKKLMFEQNTPKECIDAGIAGDEPEAPRKCARLMFKLNAPQECIDAGITGESREDQKKCKELMGGNFQKGGPKPKFDKNCNDIQDTGEKVKCYEEFYNNAQFQFNDDFKEREVGGREFAKKMGAANPDQPCPDGVCDKFEKENPGSCPEDCGGEGVGRGYRQECQTPTQIDNLKKECRDRGEEAIVENRGGCPWVVCINKESYGKEGYGDYARREFGGEGEFRGYEESECKGGCSQECPGASRTDCVDNGRRCQCFYENEREEQPFQPQQPIVQEPQQPVQEQFTQQPPLTQVPEQETSPQATETEQQPEQQPSGEGITGGAINIDNSFWNYWFE